MNFYNHYSISLTTCLILSISSDSKISITYSIKAKVSALLSKDVYIET